MLMRTAGRQGSGGTLGTAMRYAEPLCLYMQTALDGVRAAADAAAGPSQGDADQQQAREPAGRAARHV